MVSHQSGNAYWQSNTDQGSGLTVICIDQKLLFNP